MVVTESRFFFLAGYKANDRFIFILSLVFIFKDTTEGLNTYRVTIINGANNQIRHVGMP